ncbi:MAG: E3 ubiquitin ligase family protein [Endomicrobia bacterium]|nr:E3 ubiquitin ligase family protein [Endomicrobiia bacterium]
MRNAIAIMLFAVLFIAALYLSFLGYIPKRVADIVVLAAGVYIYLESFNKYKKLRYIRDTATSKIGSLPLGFVEVYGKARRFPGLFDIYHYLSIRELPDKSDIFGSLISSGIPGGILGYKTESLRAMPFYIEDETGKVYVDPFDAEIVVETKRWRDAGYSYVESEIKDGDFVYCLGTATREKVADVRAEVNKALKEARQDKKMMLERFDINGDGTISQEEWEIARQTLEREIMDKILTPKGESIITIERGKETPIFILSNKSEKELRRKYFFQSILLLAAGVAVTVIAFLCIFNVIRLYNC